MSSFLFRNLSDVGSRVLSPRWCSRPGQRVEPGLVSDSRTLSDPSSLTDPETVQNCLLSDSGIYGPISSYNADSEHGASEPKTGL